ncbi:3-hydroxyacyl-ACP dehydratase FabZ family protein [Bacillus toyonensis]|uniref:3-hydroxyacyl-ACP dehydratase FabZ family protein n=1 Tax=Bacillus toyonensis TaxID=155322 RepID=UPI000BEF7454|nr:hypothetical protein [Bacillus toyonensis]PEM43186.1 hypothetical protein CN636_17180 [Bacillus toyonensis]
MDKEIINLLPHQKPFRFIDDIISYKPNHSLKAMYCPSSIEKKIKTRDVPVTILIEGLAQTAILYTQLETEPLKENDVPMLGSVEYEIFKSFEWGRSVTYVVMPIRLLKNQAIIKGEITVDNVLCATANLSVAVSSK